jgi:hypothetical protein
MRRKSLSFLRPTRPLSAPARSVRTAAILACLAITGAAPPSASLPYDASVFTSGGCLAPIYSGCIPAPLAQGLPISASLALVGADESPRLALDLTELLDWEPDAAPGAASAARR